ncbi:MAG: hypothetical protein QGI60_01835, partial [archaeon]|nr:hypothetical protein [archaeon]
MDLRIEIAKIVEAINDLHSSVSADEWGNASRTVFVASLARTMGKLEDLEERFKRIKKELGKGAKVGAPDFSELLAEFAATSKILENNLSLEKSKKSVVKESNIFEKEENFELYEDLSQKVQTLLLRARYMAERLNVFILRQSSAPLEGKSTAKQMLDLLQAKENEIGELRGKYENIRKQSYLGYVQEQTSVDLEQDLSNTGMRMSAMANELRSEISLHKKQVEYIENSYAELKEKLDAMQETFNDYVEKSLEVITMLKKERDYAKKVVLDVEHETLQLRNSYTSEVLSLQENKLSAKKEVEEKFKKEFDSLKKELKETKEVLGSFKKIAEDKVSKERELEEKIK